MNNHDQSLKMAYDAGIVESCIPDLLYIEFYTDYYSQGINCITCLLYQLVASTNVCTNGRIDGHKCLSVKGQSLMYIWQLGRRLPYPGLS